MVKACRDCQEEKAFSEFYKTKRGTHGLNAYCKVCYKERYHDKEKARQRTAKYREANPERWRAFHRLHQFNRRSNIAATDDGTVTDEVLKSIYETESCYWCQDYTEPDKRTLEHIIELNDGGHHSITNITMACQPCNSARLGRNK